MPKHNDSKPWERQDGEGTKAFEAFAIYLEMGEERSIRAVSQRLGKSRTLIGRWSAAYQWVERVAAYDNDVQKRAHTAAVKGARKMVDRHISIALKMQEKALKALAETDPANINPKNLVALIREATKLERESRMEIIRETGLNSDSGAEDSNLVNIISEVWKRRTE